MKVDKNTLNNRGWLIIYSCLIGVLLVGIGAVFPRSSYGERQVSAATNVVNTELSDNFNQVNRFYAYVGSGEALDVIFDKEAERVSANRVEGDLVATISRPGAADVSCTIDAAPTVGVPGASCSQLGMTATSAGIWRIEVQLVRDNPVETEVNSRDIYGWDISVKNGAATQAGRVWTERYAIVQLDQNPADIRLWYVSEFGYIYDASYQQYMGINSIFVASNTGVVQAGTCNPAYRSVENNDAQYDIDSATIAARCNGQYRMFFEAPDPSLPTTATRWDGETEWVLPAVQTPTISGLNFTQTTPNTHQGTVSFTLGNAKSVVAVEVDVNNDGDFSDAVDRNISEVYRVPGAQSVAFDGLDGQGATIPITTQVRYRVTIANAGEIHFTMTDAEQRSGGMTMQRLNGTANGRTLLYWDDSALSTNRCSVTNPTSSLAGADSSVGVHSWTNVDSSNAPCANSNNRDQNDSWGNQRVIGDWTFDPVNVSATVQFPLITTLDVVKSAGKVEERGNYTYRVPYTVKVKNTGTVTSTNVQVTEPLDVTFAKGTPTLSITSAPTVSQGPCTANTSFTGTLDRRLLAGTDSLSPGVECTIVFTVQVAYPNRESVQTDVQNNTVYASSAQSTNNGHTQNGTSFIQPVDGVAEDRSTDGSIFPVAANGDTPTPTPVQFVLTPLVPNTALLVPLVATPGVALAGVAYVLHRKKRNMNRPENAQVL